MSTPQIPCHENLPTSLRYRSPWKVACIAATVGLAVGFAGLLAERVPLLVPALLLSPLIPALMLARAVGPVRRIDVHRNGRCTLRGGVRSVSVELSEFAWVRCYRTIRRESTDVGVVVVLYRATTRHPLAKVVGEFFPAVSKRRTTIIIASGWTRGSDRRRVSASEMERVIHQACRSAGFVVEHHDGLLCERRWTARRPHAAAQAW